MSATTPRSCVTRMIAAPVSSRSCSQLAQDLRLDRHVERGRRLVGDQQARRARQRHRDHHALAHAAGELVRVGAHALARRAGCRRARSSSTARSSAARLGDVRSCARICSAIWSPTGRPGSARSSGPGRPSRSPPPRMRAQLARRWRSSRSSPPKRAEPSKRALRRAREAHQRSCAVTDLPEPDSPTIASDLAARRRENETPSTACTTPSSVREGDAQVLDLEQRRAGVIRSAGSAGRGRRRRRR